MKKENNNNMKEITDMVNNNTNHENTEEKEETMNVLKEMEIPASLTFGNNERFVRGLQFDVKGEIYDLIVVLFSGDTSGGWLTTWIAYYKLGNDSWDELKYLSEESVYDYNLGDFFINCVSYLVKED